MKLFKLFKKNILTRILEDSTEDKIFKGYTEIKDQEQEYLNNVYKFKNSPEASEVLLLQKNSIKNNAKILVQACQDLYKPSFKLILNKKGPQLNIYEYFNIKGTSTNIFYINEELNTNIKHKKSNSYSNRIDFTYNKAAFLMFRYNAFRDLFRDYSEFHPKVQDYVKQGTNKRMIDYIINYISNKDLEEHNKGLLLRYIFRKPLQDSDHFFTYDYKELRDLYKHSNIELDNNCIKRFYISHKFIRAINECRYNNESFIQNKDIIYFNNYSSLLDHSESEYLIDFLRLYKQTDADIVFYKKDKDSK